MTEEEKNFYKERNKKYMLRYAPDIECIEGLYIMFELYKKPDKLQIECLKELRKGNYTRATPEDIEIRKRKSKGAGL